MLGKHTISIMGLGWFGEPLAQELLKNGHRVLGSTQSETKQKRLFDHNIEASQLTFPHLPNDELLKTQIVVLNIPPFEGQLDWFKSFNWNDKTWMIFISSTSLRPILQSEEEWVKNNFREWTILRFGGLVGNGRHPGKILSGKKDLPGRLWPVNLIHLKDCIKITQKVIDMNLKNQILNVVCDDHRGREEFYQDYCRKNGIPLPDFLQEDESIKVPISNFDLKQFYSNFKDLNEI